MKKTILLSAVLAAGASFASMMESGNAIGALNVNASVSGNQKQVLIAVPFVGYENGGAVKVEDMVKTSDLAQGSKLYVPNGTDGGYDTWTLNADGAWVADKKVTVSATGTTVGESVPANAATANRGGAFWLEPIFKSGSTGTVFLLGQGPSDDGTSTVAANWNLIGNASLKTVHLKTLTGAKGDQIIVQVDGKLRYYSWKGKWAYQASDGTIVDTDNIAIQPGQGLWYKKASAGTINWGSFVPAAN